jgi:hypothetical protein
MKIITLQPSARVDHITADGTELTQLPYPFHVAEDGSVLRQDFWRGDPLRILGFSARPEPGDIVLWWADAVKDPQQAVRPRRGVARTTGHPRISARPTGQPG